MSEAFFEKVDVFLPGQGETLAPAYHWERTEHATGHIYYSTRKPKRAFIVPTLLPAPAACRIRHPRTHRQIFLIFSTAPESSS